MSLIKLRERIFSQIKQELSDHEFFEIEMAMGLMSIPGGWPQFNEKSPFMIVPEKGLMIATLINNYDVKFRIAVSVNLGEIRIGFILGEELNDDSLSEISEYLNNVYGDGVCLAARDNFIDFVITGQFASTETMSQAILKCENDNHVRMSEAIAVSVASSVKQYFRLVLLALGNYEEKKLHKNDMAPKSVFVIQPEMGDPRLNPMNFEEVERIFSELQGKVAVYRKISGRKSIALIHWPENYILSDSDYSSLKSNAASCNCWIELQDTLDMESIILDQI